MQLERHIQNSGHLDCRLQLRVIVVALTLFLSFIIFVFCAFFRSHVSCAPIGYFTLILLCDLWNCLPFWRYFQKRLKIVLQCLLKLGYCMVDYAK